MTITLQYPHTNPNEPQYRYRLIQLPPEVAQLIDNGKADTLTIRGLEADDAVITTDSATYALKEVQTSNTLLLLQHSTATTAHPILLEEDDDMMNDLDNENYSVSASLFSYIDLERVVPKATDQLIQLLTPSTYHGPHKEQKRMQGGAGSDAILYSWDELGGIVQASRMELKSALDTVGAVELEGSFRLISPTFLNEFIQLFVASCDIDEKDISALTEEDALQMMAEHDIPEAVVLHCMHLMSDEVEIGAGIYKLSAQKICRATGTEVLMQVKHKTTLSNFMKEWKKVTPSAFEVSLEYLQGLYLLEENSAMHQEIKYFPKSKLPPIAKDRLEQLFQVRRKWASADIMPYIQDLAENKKKLDLLLLKYTRLSKVGDQVYYSSRF
ncbi:hypothetical protein BCR33DRAFT_762792 [Rhizoclosmatium globosum]|uniref:Sister chromatid cohesion protein DCC1 n=1 Tax=Rhizoclosmatium globosum TaxID=329046 RepID=A0A1Y2CVX4_9FUNG|nr:hypothetical protein BCR33DRAFT_762792 [Rhizoclosmatium globosum]|eukprot:ORY50485.1 hypothetical protein BCR33DRAFT_762792 [Rhizoclosmatium globosum]